MAPVGQIFGRFLPPKKGQKGQYISFRLFSWKVSTGFTRNFIYKLYFRSCVKDRSQRPTFLCHLELSNDTKFRCSTILLKSFFWIHISLALYTRCSYFQRCVQYGLQRPNFLAILYPKVSKNSGLWSLVLLHMLIASSFSDVWNINLRGPILGPNK